MQETVSELIGKPLLTKSGEYLGCVKSVQTDARYGHIRNFACFDRDEEDFLLPVSAIAQFGQDALVVQYASRRACKNCVPLPLFSLVRGFSLSGSCLPQTAMLQFSRQEGIS